MVRGASFSVLPIDHQEIKAWCWLHGERLASWEVELLVQMDVARRSAIRGEPDNVGRPLTMDLFDALFP